MHWQTRRPAAEHGKIWHGVKCCTIPNTCTVGLRIKHIQILMTGQAEAAPEEGSAQTHISVTGALWE